MPLGLCIYRKQSSFGMYLVSKYGERRMRIATLRCRRGIMIQSQSTAERVSSSVGSDRANFDQCNTAYLIRRKRRWAWRTSLFCKQGTIDIFLEEVTITVTLNSALQSYVRLPQP
jgi:hypothetical protein